MPYRDTYFANAGDEIRLQAQKDSRADALVAKVLCTSLTKLADSSQSMTFTSDQLAADEAVWTAESDTMYTISLLVAADADTWVTTKVKLIIGSDVKFDQGCRRKGTGSHGYWEIIV